MNNMYPLANWDNLKRGYTFGVKTFYSDFHLGLDLIVPVGIPVYMPFDGVVINYTASEIGHCAEVEIGGGMYALRFCHLSKFGVKGMVKEGQIIGYSGNTGLSKGPHLHVDISKGAVNIYDHANFIDPSTFNFLKDPMDIKKEARLNYLEGLFPGLTYRSPIYLTPDGKGHMLVTFASEDQARTFAGIPENAPVSYEKVDALNLVFKNSL